LEQDIVNSQPLAKSTILLPYSDKQKDEMRTGFYKGKGTQKNVYIREENTDGVRGEVELESWLQW